MGTSQRSRANEIKFVLGVAMLIVGFFMSLHAYTLCFSKTGGEQVAEKYGKSLIMIDVRAAELSGEDPLNTAINGVLKENKERRYSLVYLIFAVGITAAGLSITVGSIQGRQKKE